jgi:hypothetical protein
MLGQMQYECLVDSKMARGWVVVVEVQILKLGTLLRQSVEHIVHYDVGLVVIIS